MKLVIEGVLESSLPWGLVGIGVGIAFLAEMLQDQQPGVRRRRLSPGRHHGASLLRWSAAPCPESAGGQRGGAREPSRAGSSVRLRAGGWRRAARRRHRHLGRLRRRSRSHSMEPRSGLGRRAPARGLHSDSSSCWPRYFWKVCVERNDDERVAMSEIGGRVRLLPALCADHRPPDARRGLAADDGRSATAGGGARRASRTTRRPSPRACCGTTRRSTRVPASTANRRCVRVALESGEVEAERRCSTSLLR